MDRRHVRDAEHDPDRGERGEARGAPDGPGGAAARLPRRHRGEHVQARGDGAMVTVAAFEGDGDRVNRIRVVRNPGRLRPWTPQPS